jgi:hypothetical protein
MTKKADFQSDVGQAVMGDVNEAPRLNNSNIVHLNVHGEHATAEPEEPKVITKLQRKAISDKVTELMAASRLERLQIYRDILNEFGAETIEKLRRDRYKDAIAMLEKQIEAYRAEAAPMVPTQSEVIPQPLPTAASACQECAHQKRQASQARLMMIIQTVVIVVGVAAWGYQVIRPTKAAPAVEIDTECHFEGKTYSLGSTARMQDGVVRECVHGARNDAPRWGAVQKKGR